MQKNGRKEPYSRFQHEELILRDYLAADRTVLANERTYLAYIRTALAFAIAGASLIHFLEPLVSDVAGWALIAMGVVTFAIGTMRYAQTRQRLERILGGGKRN